MSEMTERTIAVLEETYGKPLDDRAEIERRFWNAVEKINVPDKASLSARAEAHRFRPPYGEKVGIYFGDDIERADEWEEEICTRGLVNIPHGWWNRNRLLIRSDWAAYVLAGGNGVRDMTEYLEYIISGEYWKVIV